MAKELKYNHLACVHCGTQNKIKLPQDGKPHLRPCTKCGLFSVSPFALLLALGVYSDDGNACPECKRMNSIHHNYCFACGTRLGDKK